VNLTVKMVCNDKRGASDESFPSILSRLGIDAESWIDSVCFFREVSGKGE